jgi:transketolase
MKHINNDMEMRQVYAIALEELMAENEQIMLLDADLARANGTLAVREKFPERALDIGVAEANMIAVAAGLSSYGFIPFAATFSVFASRRVCDVIAISVAYAKQNVKIVGTEPGIAAELNGGTHMGIEDIGVLRSIPGMVIFEPVDCVQLYQAMPQIASYYGPVYMRLFRKVPASVFGEDYVFDLFKADVLKTGTDISIFASGIEVSEALEAAGLLLQEGINAEIVNVHTIKPLDEETILNSVSKTGCAVTAENHNVTGGLGSAVSELLAKRCPVPVEFIGIQDCTVQVGKLPYLLEKYKMTAQDIKDAAIKAVKRKK